MGVIVTGDDTRRQPFVRYLDTNGDGTGTTNANGSYTNESFYIQPSTNEVIVLHEFRIYVADTSQFSITGYGSLTARTNGVIVKATVDSQEILLTNSHPLTTNGDIINFSSQADTYRLQSSDTALIGRLSTDSFGTPLVLKGYTNDKLEVILNDSFVGLQRQAFSVQGHK